MFGSSPPRQNSRKQPARHGRSLGSTLGWRKGKEPWRVMDVRFSFELSAMGTHFCRTQRKDIFMSQAIMDPEQVRRFADELQRFNRDLQNRMGALQARFNSLGDSWQDQEQLKFSDEFKQTVK